MFLVVGLGNPGEKYKTTKHNFGFLLADKIISDYNLTLKSKKTSYELFSGDIEGSKVLVLKPLKYMNLSGSPILEVKNFYKIDLKNVIVLHDDLDVEFGRIKLKLGGGSAGHNGLKDADQLIGKNYLRLRLGIGRPQNDDYDISDYVLSKFKKEDLLEIKEINQVISDLFPLLFEEDKNEFTNKFYLK
jgi:PTH1 family peptidyl-tRNA hydrolase